MDIELSSKALQLKSILNKVNDTSYAYSQISKRFPYQNATSNADLERIIKAYDQLLTDLVNYLQTTNYGKSGLG